MTLRDLIFICVVTSVLTSCSRGYKVEEEKVYYEYWNEGSGQNKMLMEAVDAKTFETLEFDCDCSFYFARDKNHLYIDGKAVKDIDPHSFEFLGNYVFRDCDSAYFFGFYNDINDCAIKGINPDRLKLIGYPWSKAGDTLIYGYRLLFLEDIQDFVPIDEKFGRTKKQVVYEDKILEGADPETFRVINLHSGNDKNNTYEFGEIKK